MRNEGPTLAQRVSAAKRGGRGRKGVEETPERSFSRPFAITDRIHPLSPPFSPFEVAFMLWVDFRRPFCERRWKVIGAAGIGNSRRQENRRGGERRQHDWDG
ncbi:hypothetical protein BT69DRAFT_663636 [Atractiella rhizophila]|nr:hypothetical protein BT69DRAFT_663636 [Atractiella rhizophila]